MGLLLTVKYRNEMITFTEFNERWNRGDYSDASLAKVKKYIDAAHKEVIAGKDAHRCIARRLPTVSVSVS